MKLLTDMHIHTVASGHAYSTVNENIEWASKKGIKVIAITDHCDGLSGGAHPFHFHNLKVIPRKVYDVIVLRGVEANIIDYDGNIDVHQEIIESIDLVIASMHPPCLAFGTKEQNTKAFIGAMNNPNVHIIGHPGDARYPFDIEAVVKAAKETNTWLEVNNASLRPISFRPGVRENLIEMLKFCKEYKVPVIVNTDAHICYDVGEMKESLALLQEVGFPKELVLNTTPERILERILPHELKSLI